VCTTTISARQQMSLE